MAQLKILNAEPLGYTEPARATLRSFADLDERALTRDQLLAAIATYDVLIVRLGHRIDRPLLAAAKNLKFVVTATTGLDHIDLEAARQAGVAVLSLRDEPEFLKEVRATAELALGLLLALIRKIPQAARSVGDGGWDRDRFQGRELYRKTAGVVGMGRLGTIMAESLKALGMTTLGYDIREDFPHHVAERVGDLCEMLARCDVVSLHVKLNPDTTGMIGARELAAMKPNAVLVNTARGGVVDETALLAALREKQIAGAALDTLCGEPMIDERHPLVQYAQSHDNLLIVPHIGGHTAESFEKTELFMAEKLKRAALAGSAPA